MLSCMLFVVWIQNCSWISGFVSIHHDWRSNGYTAWCRGPTRSQIVTQNYCSSSQAYIEQAGATQIVTLYLGTTIDWMYMQNIGPSHIFRPFYIICMREIRLNVLQYPCVPIDLLRWWICGSWSSSSWYGFKTQQLGLKKPLQFAIRCFRLCCLDHRHLTRSRRRVSISDLRSQFFLKCPNAIYPIPNSLGILSIFLITKALWCAAPGHAPIVTQKQAFDEAFRHQMLWM